MDTIKNNAIKLFFVLVIIFTVMVDFVLVKTEAPALYLILMWLSAIAAIISNIYQSITCKENLVLRNFLMDFVLNHAVLDTFY